MEIMSEFEDKWIDAEIINPPYNDIINVCYYNRYINFDGSRIYEDSYQTIEDSIINNSRALDLVYKWKPFRKSKTNG